MADNKENLEGPILYMTIDSWLKVALIIIGVVALGFIAINQGLGFFYKAQFLKGPCNLCGEINPGVESCIKELNSARPSFWTGENGTGWSDPFATP